MTVGLLQLRLRIPENQSLKGKRQVLLSLKSRIRRRFNVSVAEVDEQDKWQVATLAVCCVGTDQPGVNRQLSLVADLAREEREAELIDEQMEFI
ncbi:MAG: DUF503 domain-containing protein [Candidatus Omnitrophica bacterium]|nr:DUF503 domain-containing protein [Candidatus Omnitrophota bacterium]